jgi:hypothetical protein
VTYPAVSPNFLFVTVVKEWLNECERGGVARSVCGVNNASLVRTLERLYPLELGEGKSGAPPSIG